MDTSLSSFCARRVPRYTSYPTAPHFGGTVDGEQFGHWLGALPDEANVSLYLHVPFCKALCHYCGCHTKVTNHVEPIAAYGRLLVKEVETVARHIGARRLNVTHIHWGGGTPSMMPADAFEEILAAIGKAFNLGRLEEHAIELDPRTVTRPLAQMLMRAGVNRASLGVQDFTPRVQKEIGRPQPFGVVVDATRHLRDAGIADINFDLMYGLPAQTARDLRRTATLAAALKPSRLALFGYAHVPWFKKNQQLIDETLLPNAEARLEQAEGAAEALRQAGYVRIGLDHYAHPDDRLAKAFGHGVLSRNFQGYTTDSAPALIGMGVSSISKVPTGYAQNTPDFVAYRRHVEAGELPTCRGVVFSEDDRVRGAVIERLMCDMRVDLDDVAGSYGVASTTLQPENTGLEELSSEGLVQFDGHVLTVTERGRPFVRIAAALFDSYLANDAARHSEAV